MRDESGRGRAVPPGGGRRRRSGRTPEIEQGTVLAGYRLIRLLGRGAHSEVYLARSTHAAAGGREDANVAIKLVPASRRSAGEAEILALHAVTSDHVVQLHDVATLGDGGLCLVQAVCARGTAAGLVRRRGTLTPGEIVTLVASILRGIGDLHAAGFAHGAVDLTHVLLDGSGRPVLAGLASCRRFEAEGTDPIDDDPRPGDPVAHDLARAGRIVAALREPGDPPRRASSGRWEAWLRQLDDAVHGESDLTAHDLADLLLDVADAAPLADPSPDGDPSDLVQAGHPDPSERPQRQVGDRPALRPRGLVRGLVRGLRRRGDATRPRRHRAHQGTASTRLAARVASARSRMRRELSVVRRRVWVLGGTALVAVVLSLCLVPLLEDAASGAPTGVVSPSSDPDAARGQATGDGAEVAQPVSPASPTAAADGDDTTERDAASEDPGVAAPALLRLRASCLRGGDPACLARVDQAGSPLDDADRTTISAPEPDALTDAALHISDEPDTVQRMGDTALVALRARGHDASSAASGTDAAVQERRPASLLMVRGEAGWRIRDLMDDR